MRIHRILGQHGWELVERQNWTAVQDDRPEFRAVFTTNRVGKIVDTSFYVTLTQLAEVVQELTRQLGRDPVSVKSTNGTSASIYWGFNTEGVSEEDLTSFVAGLAAIINILIKR